MQGVKQSSRRMSISGGSLKQQAAPCQRTCVRLSPACFRDELHALLREERLFGATLLVFANKQDIPSALSVAELEKVRPQHMGVGEPCDHAAIRVKGCGGLTAAYRVPQRCAWRTGCR